MRSADASRQIPHSPFVAPVSGTVIDKAVSTRRMAPLMEGTMSSGSEFEEFARDCVRLASQTTNLELREKLFNIAREWMKAAMDGEDARTARSNPNRRQARR